MVSERSTDEEDLVLMQRSRKHGLDEDLRMQRRRKHGLNEYFTKDRNNKDGFDEEEEEEEEDHYHKPHDEATTCIALLKAWVPKKEWEKCKRLHVEIARNELRQKNTCVGSTLVIVYAKCGALSKA